MTNYIYSWKFEDKKNRSQLWYIIALSIVIWLAIWWFLTKQYGMSFIVLLIAWLVFFVENNSEDEIEVKITDLWIYIWESFYDYNGIQGFSIWYLWDSAEILRLYLNKKWIAVLDLNVNILYKEMIWVGVTYRLADAVAPMLGYQYKFENGATLKIGYSYGITTSQLGNYNNGTLNEGIKENYIRDASKAGS